jgi:serine/threonine-protein phosphatase 2B catalytic subunit
MLLAILSICSEEELLGSDDGSEDDSRTFADVQLSPAEVQQRRQQIKNKIMAVGRMQRVFQLLRFVSLYSFIVDNPCTHCCAVCYREESENASELMMSVEEDLPQEAPVVPRIGSDALGVQGNQIRRNIHSFDDA